MAFAFEPRPFAPNSQPLPPRPRPFHMTEPVYERGVWCFWLAADDPILQYVSHLNCVLAVSYMAPSFAQRPQGRALVAINPRYDYEEVWLWLDDLLAAETQAIHLGEAWEVAINSACDEGLSDEWDR